MSRRELGRDFGLTARMTLALALLLVLYAAIGALALALYELAPGWWVYWLAVALALVVSLERYYRAGDGVLLRSVGARLLEPADAPELFARVERLAAIAELPCPRLAVVDTNVSNAFAAGFRQRNSTIVLTAGLIEQLTPAELDAVLGHELAHLANRDAAVMTAASFPRTVGRQLVGDQGIGLVWIVVWPLGIPLFAAGSLITLSLSRYREFAADRGSAILTGAPEQLVSALVKVAGSGIPDADLRFATVEAFCIVPLQERRFTLLMDHPPLRDRIAALEEISRELGRAV